MESDRAKMRVLSVERASFRSHFRSIWISEARILTTHAEPESVIIAVDGKIYSPEDDYFQKPLVKIPLRPDHTESTDHSRCAGIVDATDQEVQIISDAGYRLQDLRRSSVTELTELLGMRVGK